MERRGNTLPFLFVADQHVPIIVIRGLEPRIHVAPGVLDARVKPEHDEGERSAAQQKVRIHLHTASPLTNRTAAFLLTAFTRGVPTRG